MQSSTATNPPTVVRTQSDGSPSVIAAGSWTVAHIQKLEEAVEAMRGARGTAAVATIGAQGITELDTFGAALLSELTRICGNAKGPARLDLPHRFVDLYDQIDELAVAPQMPPERRNWLAYQLQTLGRATVNIADDLNSLAAMLGRIWVAFLRTLVRPSTFRFTSAVHQLDRVAWQAVPIILLITFLIGAIIAQQGIFHFRKFGADEYVVDMVGILVLREIGVLIVAIMVAGRSGSSYTAELGSMKMREEIDALQTMGLDPVEVLILPRVIALIIGLPILTFLGSMSALYGGELVCWFYGGMAPEIFLARLKEAISITHFKVGMIKSPFMALVIGVVACAQGLRVKGSSESLGLETTASVVKSIFLVIVLDGVFAIFFASIDM
ncbi:MAG: ABC transporter permease [Hyphomicrobiaceae bacterium]